jgi:hypothetical protein
MADDKAVTFSIGYLEDYLENCQKQGLPNAEAALTSLKTVEEGFNQYRQFVNAFRKIMLKLKGDVDAAAIL